MNEKETFEKKYFLKVIVGMECDWAIAEFLRFLRF